MIRHLLSASGLALCLCAVGCTPDVAGGATDTESGGVAMGRVVDTLSVAVVNAQVSFYPPSFDPRSNTLPDSLSVTTDSAGRYVIRLAAGVAYTMIAEKENQACSGPTVQTVERDTVELGSVTLLHRGSVKVTIPRSYLSHSSNVYIKGSPYSLTASSFTSDPSDSAMVSATLNSLPAGLLPEIVYADSVNEYSLSTSVPVTASDTAQVLVTGSLESPASWGIHNSSTGAPFDSVFAFDLCPIHGALWMGTETGMVLHATAGWAITGQVGKVSAFAMVADSSGLFEDYLESGASGLRFHEKTMITTIPQFGVTAIASNRQGRFIVGTTLGYYLYNAGDTSLDSFASSTAINAVTFDRSGFVWTAGTSGVVKSDALKQIGSWVAADMQSTTSDVRALAVDSLNTIWAGTAAGELLHFTGQTWNAESLLLDEAIVGIAPGPGVLCVAGQNGSIVLRRGGSDRLFTLASIGITAPVTSITCDIAGTVFIGTAGQGMVTLILTP